MGFHSAGGSPPPATGTAGSLNQRTGVYAVLLAPTWQRYDDHQGGGQSAVKILVVEDDPLVGPAIRAILESGGHEVIGPCRDAAKALRRAVRERPDLAVVDFNLAGGEDGLSLARKLRDLHAVPSLVVSGYAHRAVEAREVAVGFLHKPFSPLELAGAVRWVEEVVGGLPMLPASSTVGVFMRAA